MMSVYPVYYHVCVISFKDFSAENLHAPDLAAVDEPKVSILLILFS